jgi:hypothetical protein
MVAVDAEPVSTPHQKAREIEADEEHSAADKLMERLAKTPKSRKPAGKPSTDTPTNLKR